MKILKLSSVTLSFVPPGNINLIVGHKIPTASSYTIDSSTVTVKPDGTLLDGPFVIGSFPEGLTLKVMAQTDGGEVIYEEEIKIPDPVPEVTDIYFQII